MNPPFFSTYKYNQSRRIQNPVLQALKSNTNVMRFKDRILGEITLIQL